MTKYLIIHHTAVSRETQPAQFYAVNRYHKEKWNMKSSLGYYHGYTHFMGTNGVITQTRALTDEGAHTIGYNKSGHIALCIAGDFNIEMPTAKQIDSLKKFITQHKDYTVKFHSDLNKRTCPGKLLTKGWLNGVIKNITPQPDKEDSIKQAEIQRLNRRIDELKETIGQLISFIVNKLR